MNLQNQSRVKRGIVAVRAESGDPNIAGMVDKLNQAFGDFKTANDEKIDTLRSELDATNIKMSGIQMGVGRSAAEPEMTAPSAAAAVRANLERVTAHYQKRASDKNESKEATLADLFRATAGLKPHNPAILASLSEGTNTDGGYAVPDTVMPKILSAMIAQSSLLSAGAQVIPVPEGAKSIGQAAIDSLPTAAWRKELGSITESAPTFRAITATPKSLACIVRISRELLADAPDMDRALREVLTQAFALELDRVGLVGTGTDPEPKGLANVSGVNAVATGTNGKALADYSAVLAGIGAILEADGPLPTAAIMAPRTLVDFGGLTASDDQPLQAPTLVQPIRFLQTSQVATNETVGTSTDASKLYIGDFSRCAFVMRETMSLQVLREAYAKTGELAFMAHVRGDFVVNYPKAFAIVSGVRPAA